MADCQLFNPRDNAWSVVQSMGRARVAAGAAWMGNSAGVIMVGGYDDNGPLDDTEIFDGSIWLPGPFLPQAALGVCVVPLPNGGVLAIGGSDQDTHLPSQLFRSTYTLDDAFASSWTEGPPLNYVCQL